jgi:hypothetical protein
LYCCFFRGPDLSKLGLGRSFRRAAYTQHYQRLEYPAQEYLRLVRKAGRNTCHIRKVVRICVLVRPAMFHRCSPAAVFPRTGWCLSINRGEGLLTQCSLPLPTLTKLCRHNIASHRQVCFFGECRDEALVCYLRRDERRCDSEPVPFLRPLYF